jgi:hypothetical protein
LVGKDCTKSKKGAFLTGATGIEYKKVHCGVFDSSLGADGDYRTAQSCLSFGNWVTGNRGMEHVNVRNE